MSLLSDLLGLLEPLNEITEEQSAREVLALKPLDQATEGDISFLSSAKYRRSLAATKASFVLVAEKEVSHCPGSSLAIVVADPYLSYAKISHFFDQTPKGNGDIHPTAIVHDDASIGRSVSIGPYAVVSKGAVIAEGAVIGAHSFVDEFAVISSNSRLQARVTIAHHCMVGEDCLIQSGTVIGSNGFGYAPSEKGWQPIAQLGRVCIGNRVEIGANCTIDRGAIEDTFIDDDVIIDNLVHIAHNVKVGKRTALAGQVGIAGSTDIGADCSAGGQAGFTGHVTIADNSHFTGQAMITKGTTDGGLYSSGIPAQSSKDWRKMVARIRQLEKINERLAALENEKRKANEH